MTNKEIARKFNQLAKLMEYHDENKFKIRSYSSAYINLRKIGQPISEMSEEDIASIPGVGKAIFSKIQELLDNGELTSYRKYADQTPQGILDLLSIRGIGPKKLKLIHDQLGIDTPGELLYACNENRLIGLKGFGLKTQEDVKNKLRYFLQSNTKILYPAAVEFCSLIISYLQSQYPEIEIATVGQVANKLPVIDTVECICSEQIDIERLVLDLADSGLQLKNQQLYWHKLPVYFNETTFEEFDFNLVAQTVGPTLFEIIKESDPSLNEKDIFESVELPYIPVELRDLDDILDHITDLDRLIKSSDIKGLIHCHSTYSDGINTLDQMSQAAQDYGLEYMLITDHSKSAFYAGGLKEDDLVRQWKEIDQLNGEYNDFKIFKGIESDILASGALDYDDDYLEMFDVIIASIHSHLRMDENKATARLINAIENPFTRILGHPTGRLLLAREAYPINHAKVIDACAANDVVIELNANPNRLDLDYKWISYAQEKSVMISINPDAHSAANIDHIKYGINMARKGLLLKENCLNAMDLDEFSKWIM